MANSTAMITDMTTVATNGPSSVTTANAIAPAGPIEDYPGMVQSVITDLSDLKTKLNLVLVNTDAGSDATNLALIQKVYNNLS
jgi:hypothetical protein